MNRLSGRALTYFANHFFLPKVRRSVKKAFIENDSRTFDNKDSVKKAFSDAPVILLGMHRSGTTLMSQLLRQMGLPMGWLRGSNTDESFYFQLLNRAIFSIASARWDRPESLIKLVEDEAFINKMSTVLYQYGLSPVKSVLYSGVGMARKDPGFFQPAVWGWKDPRTCITLPIWLNLFPNARIIYIQRNAIDVVSSLMVRNHKFIDQKPFSERCCTMSGAFDIWETYNQQCLMHLKGLDENLLHVVRYEDFLADPLSGMQRILQFIALPYDNVKLNEALVKIDRKKAYAFLNKAELVSFYDEVKESEIMRALSYDKIC